MKDVTFSHYFNTLLATDDFTKIAAAPFKYTYSFGAGLISLMEAVDAYTFEGDGQEYARTKDAQIFIYLESCNICCREYWSV